MQPENLRSLPKGNLTKLATARSQRSRKMAGIADPLTDAELTMIQNGVLQAIWMYDELPACADECFQSTADLASMWPDEDIYCFLNHLALARKRTTDNPLHYRRLQSIVSPLLRKLFMAESSWLPPTWSSYDTFPFFIGGLAAFQVLLPRRNALTTIYRTQLEELQMFDLELTDAYHHSFSFMLKGLRLLVRHTRTQKSTINPLPFPPR